MVTPGRFCKSGISKILVIARSLDVLIGCRLSEPFYLNLIFFTKCLLPEQIEGSHLNIWDLFQVKWKVEYQSKIKSLHCNTQPEIFNFLFCILWVVFKLFAIIFFSWNFHGNTFNSRLPRLWLQNWLWNHLYLSHTPQYLNTGPQSIVNHDPAHVLLSAAKMSVDFLFFELLDFILAT